MQFRHTLDGTVLAEGDVLGYQDLEETIRREETFLSLVNELVGEIEFVGAAATQIAAAIIANPCQELTFLTERIEPDGTFTEDFDGKIDLVGVTIDVLNCIYRTSVLSNDLSARIRNNIESVYFFRQTKSLDGSVTITNNVYNNRKTCIIKDPNFAALDENRLLYRVDDVFQGFLDFITNNGITFESDFFTNDGHQTTKWEILNTGLVAGDLITIGFDLFSGSHIFTNTFVNAVLLQRALYEFLATTGAASNDEDYAFNRNGDVFYLNVELFGSFDYRIESANDFTITSVGIVGAGTNDSFTRTQTATYGMDDLMFSTGNNLKETPASVNLIPPSLSLDTILKEMNKYFFTTFRIIKSGGTQTFKLEPFQDFLASTDTLTVNFATNLEKEVINDFNQSTVTPGDGATPEFTDAVNTSVSYKSQDCDGRDLDISTTFINDSFQIYEVVDPAVDQDQDGLTDFYLLMMEDASIANPISERITWNDSTTVTEGFFNTFLTNFQKIRANFLRLADNIGGNRQAAPNSPGLDGVEILITNTKTINIVFKTSFSAPLTCEEFDLLKAGETEKIKFNTDFLTNAGEGWIFEVTRNKSTGLTRFILYTEN